MAYIHHLTSHPLFLVFFLLKALIVFNGLFFLKKKLPHINPDPFGIRQLHDHTAQALGIISLGFSIFIMVSLTARFLQNRNIVNL